MSVELALQVEVDKRLHVLEISIKLIRGLLTKETFVGWRGQEPLTDELARGCRHGPVGRVHKLEQEDVFHGGEHAHVVPGGRYS